jgi:YVTN family beta-propeller protein
MRTRNPLAILSIAFILLATTAVWENDLLSFVSANDRKPATQPTVKPAQSSALLGPVRSAKTGNGKLPTFSGDDVINPGLIPPSIVENAIYLSDLTPVRASEGNYAGKSFSRPLSLKGAPSPSGLRVVAPSELCYSLEGQYLAFLSDIGLDDAVGAKGSVIFQIFADGEKLYDSGEMSGRSAAKNVFVNLLGKNELRLVVADAGDGNRFDIADWADAKLIRSLTASNATPASTSTSLDSLIIPMHAHGAGENLDGHAKFDAEMAVKMRGKAAFVAPKSLGLAVAPQQLSQLGTWGPVRTWPFAFASAANLPDGRILAWGGNNQYYFNGGTMTYAAYWNPTNDQITSINNNNHSSFCGIPTMMADGKVFLNGGDGTRKRVSIYDYLTNQWIRSDDMNIERWYPGSVMMPNGQVYTALGEPGSVYPEIWTQGSGWTLLTGANLQGPILNFAGYQNNWLPYVHLAPDGRIFHSGPTQRMNWLTTTGNGGVTNANLTNTWYPKYAAAIMYDQGKLMISGGQVNGDTQDATNQAMVIDLNGATPTKTIIAPMSTPRKFHNAIALPNGEVLLVGGNRVGIEFSDDQSNLTPEIWNPTTGAYRTVADHSVPRNYHSLLMLMTDGRVWSGGGGLCGCSADHPDHQIYTPGYLYNPDGTLATRPQITSGPTVISVGATATMQATAGIQKFSLIKMTGLTHNMNSDLRFLNVPFTANGNQYQLTFNNNINVLTPGFWMLFALNNQGVPSVARVVRVVTNGTPAITAIGDQNTIVSTATNLQVIANDPDGQSLTYSATGLPPGLSINTSTGLISGTPATQGSYTVNLTVSDSGGANAATNFLWTIRSAGTSPGIFYEYYLGTFNLLPNFNALTSNKNGVLTNFSLGPKTQEDYFAFRFTGKISIGTAGSYTFYTESDDGSRLWIDGQLVVDNDGLHAMEEKAGTVTLTQGLHDIVVGFFEADGGDDLIVRFSGPGIAKQTIPSGRLFYTSNVVVVNPGTQNTAVGSPVNLAIQANGGIGALTYAATGLPTGLTINANTGVISGTPTTVNTFNVTVTVTDTRGVSSGQSFSWAITQSALVVNPIVSTPKPVNTSINYTASVSSAVNPRFKWLFGDDTPETAYSTSPTIAHTYTQPGLYVVKLTATDDRNIEKSIFFTQAAHLPPTANRPAVSMNIIYEARATGNHRVWAVNQDNDTVSVFDAVTNNKLAEIAVGASPRAVAVAPDGRIWVTNKRSATISIISPTSLAVVQTLTLAYGSMPYGLAFAPTGTNAFVTLEATGRLLRLDASTGAQSGSLDLGPNVRHLSISGDGTKVYVSRFITPLYPGEDTAAPQVSSGGGQVLVVNAQAMTLGQTITLRHSDRNDTENSGRGVPNYLGPAALSPDGVNAWTPSKQDNILRGTLRDGRNLTFESTIRSITSHINLTTGQEDYPGRLDLNNAGIASTALYDRTGSYLFVAAEGSREVIVLDPYGKREFMHIPVGRAPQGLAISADGLKLYVHNFMDRSINVVDVSKVINEGDDVAPIVNTYNSVASERLTAQVLNGKRLFYDAQDPRLARDAYISCASCHNDGDGDGRVWDFTGMGEGLRNTIALNGRAGAQGFKHWSANFDEVQDFEGQIRNLSGGTGLMTDAQFNTGTRSQPLGQAKAGVSADLDALAAYVSSLTTFDKSPYRTSGGALTAAATAGKTIFQSMNCAQCHGGAGFTVSGAANLFDIGTIKPSSGGRLGGALTGIDSPTLRDLWATAPYLHDGSAPTLGAAVRAHNGVTISDADLNNLVAYLQQIGSEEPAPSGNQAPTVSITAPANNATFTAPASVTINATAADADGTVSKVEFFQGATKLGEDLTSPYTYSWTNVAAGAYSLTAVATDNANLTTTSAVINITVGGANQPPTVSITAPATGAPFVAPAAITINATAADANGTVSKVEFFQGATKLGEDLTSPYTFNWAAVPVGSYSLTAVATDNANATTTSTPVNITVTTAPTGGTGLTAQYFNGVDFNTLALTRVDPTVNLDVGDLSPAAGVGIDNFSVRWNGQVQPLYTQTYTFYTNSDDGVRLSVNGQQIINNWTDHGPTEDIGTIALTAGTKYDITMEFYERGGGALATLSWSSTSQAKQIIPQSALYPTGGVTTLSPPQITGSGAGNTTANLIWTSVNGAAGYRIRYGTTSGTYTQTMDVGVVTTATIPNLTNGLTYYFVVAAVNGTVVSVNSNQVSVIPAAPPTGGAGTGLKADYYNGMNFGTLAISRTDPTVNFNWGVGAPPGTGLGIDLFSVRWSGQVQPLYTQTYTFYTNTDDGVRLYVNGVLIIDSFIDQAATERVGTIALTAGQKYDIVMEYFENGGDAVATLSWSSASQAKQIIPQTQLYPAGAPPALGAPTITSSSAAATTVTINWGAVSGATGYTARLGTASGTYTTNTPVGNVLTHTFTGLTAGTTYYLTVAATNATTTSVNATQATQTTTGATLAAPTITSSSAAATTVTINWGAVSGATGYTARLGTASGTYTTNTPVGNVLTHTFTGLANGTTYYLAVAATNATTTSVNSTQVTQTTTGATLAAPTISSSSAGNGSATINWGAVTGATGYTVKYGTTSGTYPNTIPAGNVLTRTVTGLTNGTIYYFVVAATNATSSSVNSAQVSVTPTAGGAPGTPTITASSFGNGTAHLSWGAVAGATGYTVKYGTTSGTYPTTVPLGNVLTHTVSGLTNNTTYYFVVAATNGAGSSANSAQVSIRPAAGTGLKGEYFTGINFNQLVLTRTDPTINFNWGEGTPAAQVPGDNFSVRWTGQVQPQYSQTYTFYYTGDDGIRLWVNGQLLINAWVPQASVEYTGTIALTANQKYNIVAEFYEEGGGAVAILAWSSPSRTKQVIPQNRLFPTTGTVANIQKDLIPSFMFDGVDPYDRHRLGGATNSTQELVGVLDPRNGFLGPDLRARLNFRSTAFGESMFAPALAPLGRGANQQAPVFSWFGWKNTGLSLTWR